MEMVQVAINEVLDESRRAIVSSVDSKTRVRIDLDLDSLDLAVLTVKLEAKTDVDVFAKGIVSCSATTSFPHVVAEQLLTCLAPAGCDNPNV